MTDALSVFAPTADQRFLLGEDVFFRTHYPMTMRRYAATGKVDLISEEDLLVSLLGRTGVSPGNRLWILYGAPGSGKSEMVKWVETRVAQEDPDRRAVTLRISRNELDVLSVVKGFLDLLPDTFLAETTIKRWREMRQKSRTLTKIILLFALESLLESDEVINALFYRLLNAVHPHIDQVLAAEESSGGKIDQLELISRETWNAIVTETSLPIALEYEQFRYQLTVAFQNHLLDGISLADTMERISKHIALKEAMRPILLVDDLVQSLNIFATDILDYLLTLEAGNWDVIVGLTPAAFEDSQRGRELLQRVNNLDTVDDRVEKLWLSDETGQESYVLTEQNSRDFALKYLDECNMGERVGGPSVPINRELLVRIYRGLPQGKGKVRYFVRHLGEILARVAGGEDPLSVLPDYAETEYVARSENVRLNRVCELYGPLLTEAGDSKIALAGEILRTFHLSERSSTVAVEPVIKFYRVKESEAKVINDEEKAAVRDWLLGRPANRQMLKRVRQGAARWLRTTGTPTWLYRPYISRPTGALRHERAYLSVKPPILLEGVDDEDVQGVRLSRDVGMVAFDLYHYASSTGSETKALRDKLASAPELIALQNSAAFYRDHLRKELEEVLTMSIAELALSLYIFSVFVNSVRLRAPGATDLFWENIARDRARRAAWQHQVNGVILAAIQKLFTDYYKLRENIYDGQLLAASLQNQSPDILLRSLLKFDAEAIPDHYRLGGIPLKQVLAEVQEVISVWLNDRKNNRGPLSKASREVIERLFAANGDGVPLVEIPMETWGELQQLRPELFANLRITLQMPAHQ